MNNPIMDAVVEWSAGQKQSEEWAMVILENNVADPSFCEKYISQLVYNRIIDTKTAARWTSLYVVAQGPQAEATHA